MDADRVRTLIKFILATAGANDDFRDRDLGPIHVLKYLYLADISFAERNSGQTFTGIPWRFYHFGPYATEPLDDIYAVPVQLGAHEDRRPSDYEDEKEWVRWRLRDEHAAQEAGRLLPLPITLGLKRAIREFGSDTSALLHHVYGTRPMLQAAPGEQLIFEAAPTPTPTPAPPSPTPKLRPKAAKRRLELLAEARERFKAAAEARRCAEAAELAGQAPTVYDEAFEEGTRYLDELAGASPAGLTGAMEFDDSIWKSTARRGPHGD